MSRKQRKPEKEVNNERWLLTYSDLITLLMIFFVVMYAMSNVDVAKYNKIAQSLGVALGGGKNVIQVTPGVSDSKQQLSPGASGFKAEQANLSKIEEGKLSNLKSQIDAYLQKNGLKGSVATEITVRGLEINLRDTVLFDSGKADIKPDARGKLIAIGRIISVLPNLISIEGHTDNVPIHNSLFTSNWRLSAIRATNAAELLIEAVKIPQQKVSTVGYGEINPKMPYTSDANRAQNRRVNIVILNSMYNPPSDNKLSSI
jgi:chemotaxis protein MotB